MTDSVGKQEKIIAEVQDIYQPSIQVISARRLYSGVNILYKVVHFGSILGFW